MKQSNWYSPFIAANLDKCWNRASVSDVKEGLEWYYVANKLCEELGAKYSLPTNAVCGIMAALSPGRHWELNKQDCDTFCDEWSNGARGKRLPLVGSYGWRNIVKASKIASGKDPLEVLGGNKVRAFYECLSNPWTTEAVCIDRHAKFAAYGKRLSDRESVVRNSEYSILAKHYIRAARRARVLPHQYQAVVWCCWRRLKGNLAQLDLITEVPF